MTTLDAIIGVRAALETLVGALESWRPDDVLAAEAQIATAARAFSTSDTGTPFDPDVLRRDLIETHALIARCRSLGAVASDVEAAIFPASYGATGARLRRVDLPSTVAART